MCGYQFQGPVLWAGVAHQAVQQGRLEEDMYLALRCCLPMIHQALAGCLGRSHCSLYLRSQSNHTTAKPKTSAKHSKLHLFCKITVLPISTHDVTRTKLLSKRHSQVRTHQAQAQKAGGS
jgi:hypothetical protein